MSTNENHWCFDEIIEKIENSSERIFILKAGTGSGKSTYFLPKLFKKSRKSILCTQPRIINIEMIAKSIDNLLPHILKLRYNLGYLSSIKQINPTSKKHLILLTTEILTIKIKNIIKTETNNLIWKEIKNINENVNKLDSKQIIEKYTQHTTKKRKSLYDLFVESRSQSQS